MTLVFSSPPIGSLDLQLTFYLRSPHSSNPTQQAVFLQLLVFVMGHNKHNLGALRVEQNPGTKRVSFSFLYNHLHT